MRRIEAIQKNDNWLLFIVILTTFLPTDSRFSIVKLLLILVAYVYKSSSPTIPQIKLLVLWIENIGIASLAVIICEGTINSNTILHELIRVIYYYLVVALCSKMRISLRSLYISCSIVIWIHFTIQLTQYLRLGIVDSFITRYYLSGDVQNVHYVQAINTSYSFRSGSIFINPNVYVCYPYLSIGVFLQYYQRHAKWNALIMVVIAFISVVLTGSRMGMVTCICIMVWYIIKEAGKAKGKNNIYILVGLLLVFVLLNWNGDLRAFQFGQSAYENSLGIKLSSIGDYLKISNPVYWLTGSLGSPSNFHMDIEYGYIFAWFGFFGFIWYSRLLRSIYRTHSVEFKLLSNITIISVLLTGISATSILNMSVFPYICLISFPMLFDAR